MKRKKLAGTPVRRSGGKRLIGPGKNPRPRKSALHSREAPIRQCARVWRIRGKRGHEFAFWARPFWAEAFRGTRSTMSAVRRRRSIAIAVGSGAVHALVLTLVALHAPQLKVLPSTSGPPQAVIPVLIVPRVPPPHASRSAPAPPIRLHRRPQRFADETLPIAPLIVPESKADRPAPVEAARSTGAQPGTDALAANVRGALRSRVQCDSPNLTRAEREGCLERLGADARNAPFLGLGLERGKAGDLAAAADRRERDFKYMRSAGPPGTTGAGPSTSGNAVGRGNNLPGSAAKDIGAMVGSDNPTYKVPF